MRRIASTGSLLLILMLALGCTFWAADPSDTLARDRMRDFVAIIAAQARIRNPAALIVPQNGEELLTRDGSAEGPFSNAYLEAIDGLGREDLFYGYEQDNEPTSSEATAWMLGYLQRAALHDIEVLVTDYCWAPANVDNALASSEAHGFTGFAAPSRELDEIPMYPDAPHNVHAGDVDSLSGVRNFLYLINPHRYASKEAFLAVLQQTDYDLLILDAAFQGIALTPADVSSLKMKSNGGQRLVLCYLSIGEAEDYRSYWDASWEQSPPEWLLEENPNWPGNYPVEYWHPVWQAIILQAVDRVMDVGFDGLYLDRIDVYELFE